MNEQSFPEGAAFLDLVRSLEQACVDATIVAIPNLGKKAGETNQALGTLTSKMYREACCFYGCNGGDHFPQYLTGRVVTNSFASHRLLTCGYYDVAQKSWRGSQSLVSIRH